MRHCARHCTFLVALVWLFPAGGLSAGGDEGRVFSPTCETVGIWEFNRVAQLVDGALVDAGLVEGDTVPDGSLIEDLSGNGLHGTVEGNGSGALVVGSGDPEYGTNGQINRTQGGGPARVAINDDGGAFEMSETQDFSIELYVEREDVPPAADWGILAGTWHSRNLVDTDGDGVDDGEGNVDGAWYGYGLIRHNDGGGFPTGGWVWVLSPVIGGQPTIGIAGAEVPVQPRFEIPVGRHYVVLSVDRTAGTAVGYVDGVEVSRYEGLAPDWSFTTPLDLPGRDPARFLFFTGEDDGTNRSNYRGSIAGLHIDACRVQRKALDGVSVENNWFEIQDAAQVGEFDTEQLGAALRSSHNSVVVDQCLTLDASASCAGQDATITGFEWRVADGDFESGEETRELSFDSPSADGGTVVEVRVTNSAGDTATASVTIVVRAIELTAALGVAVSDGVDAVPALGDPISVPLGRALALDASESSSGVEEGAEDCEGAPVGPGALSYGWDLDGDGTFDETAASFVTEPYNVEGEFRVDLTVQAENGSMATASVGVIVVDPTELNVFSSTDDTILHLEFNDLDVGVIEGMGEVATVPDLSGNALDLSVVDPTGGSLEAVEGPAQYDGNRAITLLNNVDGGTGPARGEILEDEDLLEFGVGDDFTFEIYMKASEQVQPQWGDVAGTFRARTDGSNDSARYGWGIIKSHLDADGRSGFAWFTPNQTPNEVPVFFDLPFETFSYVACVVDRVAMTSTVYVDGALAAQRTDIDPTWSFETPENFPHANFYLFTREQSPGQFNSAPNGTSVDALRLTGRALSPEEIADNYDDILRGRTIDGGDGGDGVGPFIRGDCNGDGRVTGQVADAVFLLNFNFGGGAAPPCAAACDVDGNGAFAGAVTDAIVLLQFNFLGGPPPAAPYPECTRSNLPSDVALGCATALVCP